MKRMYCLLVICFVFNHIIFAQGECTSKVEIKLNNISGGVFPNQTVNLKSKSNGKVYTEKTDKAGSAIFTVPCNEIFIVSATNYAKTSEIQSPQSGYTGIQLKYSADMIQKTQEFAMSDDEKLLVDKEALKFTKDTLKYSGSMPKPTQPDLYSSVTLTLKKPDGTPLSGEIITIIGSKRNTKLRVVTDTYGKAEFYLPKGDLFYLHFLYHKDFANTDIEYSKGYAHSNLRYVYIGTKEVERRKKEEKLREIELAKRVAEERKAREEAAKRERISLTESYKRDLKSNNSNNSDNVISQVFKRNAWQQKLIVCDVTGSMTPYARDLYIWFSLNYRLETNIQITLFNDGDNMNDALKKIGKTGGIYYSKPQNMDSLASILARAQTNGCGGDGPENNIEALITAISKAQGYKEIIMIADNNASVKDIVLLEQFNKPVHIIICGEGPIHEDYLKIAWKTKGSIHTIKEDVTRLATLCNGQEILIGGIVYKLIGGNFVRMTNI